MWGVLSLYHFVLGNNEMELQLNKVAAICRVQASPGHRGEGLEQDSAWSEIRPNYLRASSAAFSNVRRSVLGSDQVVKNNLSFLDREKSLIFF